jgi:uncharacterized pyridoxamine 5'-phosphate oxidase family protein
MNINNTGKVDLLIDNGTTGYEVENVTIGDLLKGWKKLPELVAAIKVLMQNKRAVVKLTNLLKNIPFNERFTQCSVAFKAFWKHIDSYENMLVKEGYMLTNQTEKLYRYLFSDFKVAFAIHETHKRNIAIIGKQYGVKNLAVPTEAHAIKIIEEAIKNVNKLPISATFTVAEKEAIIGKLYILKADFLSNTNRVAALLVETQEARKLFELSPGFVNSREFKAAQIRRRQGRL